ncbi:MAG: alpha-1,2-fucosyltransferase [Flavobacteriales bacterium]
MSTNNPSHDFVTTQLAGGLGNQMFQYAFGYAVAMQLNKQLLIDTGLLGSEFTTTQHTQRELELQCFGLSLKKSTDEIIKKSENSLLRKITSRFLPFSNSEVYHEHENFNISEIKGEKNIHLKGYWQSEDYFKNYRSDLLKMFSPSENISDRNNEALSYIHTADTASIHIRRGDYITNRAANAYHGVCTVEYYTQAAHMLHEQTGVSQFLIFSDEPEWVENNISVPYACNHVTWNAAKQAHWDIYLMKHCKHNIIANSSFSWWGAWLNVHDNKKVIAPRNWFAVEKKLPYPITPADWQLL